MKNISGKGQLLEIKTRGDANEFVPKMVLLAGGSASGIDVERPKTPNFLGILTVDPSGNQMVKAA